MLFQLDMYLYYTNPSAPAICPCCSALILCKACAASSSAQLTDDVNFRKTSGSVKAFPSAVDNFPIPNIKCNILYKQDDLKK